MKRTSPALGLSQRSSLRPENKLLLYAARTAIDDQSVGPMRALLGQELDWTYLALTAHGHGVVPLLYGTLNRVGPEAVPPGLLADLRYHAGATTLRNQFLTQELLRIMERLGAHAIPAIPYKGPMLVASIYGDASLRQISDLDLLIRLQDVPRAKALLLGQGYRPQMHGTPKQEAALLRNRRQYYYALRREKGQLDLELHWRIPTTFSLPAEHLWQCARPTAVDGATVLSFPPAELLLLLCAHGFKHFWGSLKWLCDVAELVRSNPELEWAGVLELADRWGGRRVLFLGLLLAGELLGAPLPEAVWQQVRAEPEVQRLAVQVMDWLFTDEKVSIGPLNNLRVRELPRDRVQYCLSLAAHAFTPDGKDRNLLRLPTPLSPLYYLFRPIRLAGQYGRGRWKQLRRPGNP